MHAHIPVIYELLHPHYMNECLHVPPLGYYH